MKLRQIQSMNDLKCIEVTSDGKVLAYVYIDGEIIFKQSVYPLMAGEVLTIAQNIHLFIDNIKTE